jgi:hypothetical protein
MPRPDRPSQPCLGLPALAPGIPDSCELWPVLTHPCPPPAPPLVLSFLKTVQTKAEDWLIKTAILPWRL